MNLIPMELKWLQYRFAYAIMFVLQIILLNFIPLSGDEEVSNEPMVSRMQGSPPNITQDNENWKIETPTPCISGNKSLLQKIPWQGRE